MGQIVARDNKPLAAAAAEAPQQYLTFTLNAEIFAIGILHIKEIIEYGSLTEIPMMPAFIRGVINLRGAVVPVIDLSARFGGRQTEIARRTCIVIVELVQTVEDGELRQDIGIMVDSVNEVLEIPATDVEPPPAFGSRIRTDFIRAMGKVEGRFVIILDLDRVLSVEEMAQLGATADASAPATDNAG
ncbi:chemotaxis protein CheW [Azoarcus indigens]|uniref:Purine-binding chemotaxis protein CheW n=1 Tax=Azoarcus indigens TaxID=29545 RepID=A0A4R6E125_9RHOO|nr:chemotaxis protein CheW [Azoarcus indigens]NMG65536.1 chemotaxis protein CheW [Azoarcus indigens]TDN51415.1 purine-binding chemotaxis protein CheW [Azoarcus indigens]